MAARFSVSAAWYSPWDRSFCPAIRCCSQEVSCAHKQILRPVIPKMSQTLTGMMMRSSEHSPERSDGAVKYLLGNQKSLSRRELRGRDKNGSDRKSVV